ncbi:TRAP transporter small permease [Geomicrobium sp. JSM 1781026]|uniref:TRAP transporter small permease n=1 Tax=Geomicrobium sp. JSM 1781026 TaxID=3344580 RepID=UPI0035C0FFDE
MNVIRWLDRYFEEILMVIIFTVMVASISAQVFMRFVFESSFGWSEELARYCFIWMIFLGVSYAVKKQRHIRVDALLLVLKERTGVYLNIFTNVIFLGFALFLLVYGGRIVSIIFDFGQLSPALEVEMGWVYLAVPVGMALTAVRIVQQLTAQIKYLLGKGEQDADSNGSFSANEEDAMKGGSHS